jgi:hypothetical protein
MSNICKIQILYFYPIQQFKQQQIQTVATEEENPAITAIINDKEKHYTVRS